MSFYQNDRDSRGPSGILFFRKNFHRSSVKNSLRRPFFFLGSLNSCSTRNTFVTYVRNNVRTRSIRSGSISFSVRSHVQAASGVRVNRHVLGRLRTQTMTATTSSMIVSARRKSLTHAARITDALLEEE